MPRQRFAFSLALLLAYGIGLAIGVWMGAHRLSGAVGEPILVVIYSLPKITLYPVVLLIFGLGISAKVAFGAIHGIIPMAIFAMGAVRAIAPVYLRSARALQLLTPPCCCGSDCRKMVRGLREVTFFPDNQLGQEIDVINSVKLGVIDLMVSGSSISANLVPLVGTFDLGYLFSSFPQQTKAFDAGAAKPIEDALLKGANIRIISWAYNFGSRSVLAKKPVKTSGRSRRPQDQDAAQSRHHRVPAPDGRRRDAAGVRRNLYRPAGRRARRARTRSADHPRQQVLRDREVLRADAA